MSERYFVTGATGLLGAAIVERLSNEGNEVIAFVRDSEKAQRLFSNLGHVSIVSGILEQPVSYEGEVDYIIHSASPTDSRFFMTHPVETIDTIVLGSKSVLELAKEKKVKSIVNLSSMEVYGAPTDEEDLTEEKQHYLDPASIRSNYPLAKRLVENMCAAYAYQYNVPVKSARLAQVIGNSLPEGDNRVISQFVRAAQSRTDIVLNTTGETKQTYIGIEDAVDGILTILKYGRSGHAYNVANEETYCSIRELAELVVRDLANGEIDIKIKDADAKMYPPDRTLYINSGKLRELGWAPKVGLPQAIRVLYESISSK